MTRNKSKYTRDDRKDIVQSIEDLKNDVDYVAIFEILTNDSANSYTINSNGVFLNLSTIADSTLDEIIKYIRKINRTKINKIDLDVDVIPNLINNKNDRTYKLSNYEKNIIKQRAIKKALNNDNEYVELKLSNKNKTIQKQN